MYYFFDVLKQKLCQEVIIPEIRVGMSLIPNVHVVNISPLNTKIVAMESYI